MSFGSMYEVHQERLRRERETQHISASNGHPLPTTPGPTRRCSQGHTWRDMKGRCVLCKDVKVEPDQLYRNFAYTFKPGHRKEIHSKRQFLRECKQTGQRRVVADDLLKRGVPYHPDSSDSALPREAVQTAIREAQRSATKDNVERHWFRQQQEVRHG